MRTSKIVATLGAASILATGAFMPVADARVVSGNDKSIAADSVDTTRAISLLVKKRATNPYDDVPAGQKRPAIEGAIFVLSRVNDIDVTTEEGREGAKNLTMEEVREKGLGVVDKKTTNASGAVQFTGLSAGLYLLEEQAPDDDHEYHVSSPQLIILPLGDVKGERFTYENVVVTKWDDDGGLTPTTPPTPTPGTTTPATTEPTTKTTPTTPPGNTVTTVTTPVKTTLTTTRSDGSTTVVTTRTSSVTTVTKPGERTRGGDLASTGANVLWAAGLGGLLILIGFVLARRSKNEEQTR
ncbi:prealbumin-like fold domain-containing protein [Corynebacterium coyleae]|uniref:prealbumin-like fold domain-containing protein n=1 Tax=Corynebacterium coyleae TaxID=53374 RepID=UPI00254F1750|nr:prealbumin-like fold domain-containing protein [Corynebacterium coyleae]MDK8664334.1 prealbumin-like fold domain-containing protein [Corynebacterium coyleae]MDK8707608.1 prealbumin-like fold domain-containing protein [Corynebacterium coyleae]MDK8734484.1 prealbumin-like fold domain-containing protein [Corynebacterium coyleae]MDK8893471.1 prealbumin-like fold domain-containing protein [Corynebacterium coyleae]